jgi:cysteinyl-tRNA synthetase
MDDLLETTRELEGQDEKRNKQDFALWKAAAPEHIMRWASPWGVGFPGWHIECSAMSSKYLGEEFDLHGGGMDLMFPHHESEIAQSCICHHGHMPVRYWMHNNMITINGKKMGKSYNNVIKLTELFSGNHPLLQQAFTPMTIRFFILQTHYRSTLDFSNDALQAAEKGLKRLWEAYENLQALNLDTTMEQEGSDSELVEKVNRLLNEMEEFMNDDLSTAKVLANLFELVPVMNSLKDKLILPSQIGLMLLERFKSETKTWLENVLGFRSEKLKDDGKLDGVMQLLIEMRKEAKLRKDFVTSDKIRNQLSEIGILLKDEKGGGMSWSAS